MDWEIPPRRTQEGAIPVPKGPWADAAQQFLFPRAGERKVPAGEEGRAHVERRSKELVQLPLNKRPAV